MDRTITRLPYIRPEHKERPMSDSEAVLLLCQFISGACDLYADMEQIKGAIEVALEALEDRILLEDDMR